MICWEAWTNRIVIWQSLLPISVTSNKELSALQYVTDFSYNHPNITLELSYTFSRGRSECGPTYLDSSTGSLSKLLRSYSTLTDVSSDVPLQLPIAGFVSSPQVKADFDEFSRHFYYYHTDCIWVATAKPAEQWSASISTTNKGQSKSFIRSRNSLRVSRNSSWTFIESQRIL